MEKDIAFARRPVEGFEFAAWKFFKPSIYQPSTMSGNNRFVLPKRGLSYARQRAASSNLDFRFVSAYKLVALVIKFFLYK